MEENYQSQETFDVVEEAPKKDRTLLWILLLVLYALSVLSAVGVMALLTMVYSMVVVMLFKKENTIEQVAQLVMPLTAGFILALLQIGQTLTVGYHPEDILCLGNGDM